MDYLVPIVIVAIGIGLLLLFLRRPTVARPPTTSTSAKTDAPTAAPRSDDPMQEILSELTADMASGATKRVKILKGKRKIGWTVTKRLDQGSLSPGDLRVLVGKGNMEQVARDLLANLPPGSLASNAPPEAQLQYPGSSLVLDSVESQSSTAASSAESRDVYKTTLATDADAAQVLAWYRDWLLGHGWQIGPSTGTSSDSSQDYARASEHFRLAVADPAMLAPILAVPIPAGTKTVYEVEYSNTSTQPQAP